MNTHTALCHQGVANNLQPFIMTLEAFGGYQNIFSISYENLVYAVIKYLMQ